MDKLGRSASGSKGAFGVFRGKLRQATIHISFSQTLQETFSAIAPIAAGLIQVAAINSPIHITAIRDKNASSQTSKCSELIMLLLFSRIRRLMKLPITMPLIAVGLALCIAADASGQGLSSPSLSSSSFKSNKPKTRRSLDELLLFYPSKYPEGNWEPKKLNFEDAWFDADDGTQSAGLFRFGTGRACGTLRLVAFVLYSTIRLCSND